MAGAVDLDALANREVQMVADALDTRNPRLELSGLIESVASLEEALIEYGRSRVVAILTSVSDLREAADPAVGLVDSRGEFVEVAVSRDPQDPGLLVACVLPRSPGYDSTKFEFSARLLGYGEFQSLLVCVPARFEPHAEVLAATLQGVFEGGYLWLRAQLDELVNDLQRRAGERLYRFAAQVLMEPQLVEVLWFASVTERFGFRLVDADAARAALRQMDLNATAFNESAFHLMASLLATRLPREQLLMKRALEMDQPMTVSLKEATYRREGSLYASALTALYGSDAFVIWPIRNDPTISILALYPTGRVQIGEALDQHKEAFRRVADDSLADAMRTQSLFDRDRDWRERARSVYDVATLNPSIFGVGIDLKVAGEKLLQRYRYRRDR
jgi:hypothetical protein